MVEVVFCHFQPQALRSLILSRTSLGTGLTTLRTSLGDLLEDETMEQTEIVPLEAIRTQPVPGKQSNSLWFSE
jgi:hypothetical protein